MVPVASAAGRSSHPTEIPGRCQSYGLPEAARYLRMAPATLRSWILGRYNPPAPASDSSSRSFVCLSPSGPRGARPRGDPTATRYPASARRRSVRDGWPRSIHSARRALHQRDPNRPARDPGVRASLSESGRARRAARGGDRPIRFLRAAGACRHGHQHRRRRRAVQGGEPMGALADDYGRSLLEIEEAIRCELPLEAA